MKVLSFLGVLCLLCSCKSTAERASSTWYEVAEVVCHDGGCPACRGTSAVGCAPCKGVGKVKCTHCKDGTEKCGTCGGDGRKHGKECKTCDGKGRTPCSACRGTLKMECPACSGKGRLMCLRPMPIGEPMPTGDDAWPPQPK